MIDPALKRCLGQMVHGVQVVAASHAGTTRAYCSHWICQVSFAEPILVASVSPRHDTHPLLLASGRATISVLAGDQVAAGQYFSYPGRRFRRIASELLESVSGGWHAVPDALAWLGCEVIGVQSSLPQHPSTVGTDDAAEGALTPSAGDRSLDHDLVFLRVVAAGQGRLGEPALVYSARHGWRIADRPARAPGRSVRDAWLARLADEQG